MQCSKDTQRFGGRRPQLRFPVLHRVDEDGNRVFLPDVAECQRRRLRHFDVVAFECSNQTGDGFGLDEVAEITGHEVGGVCPFGLKAPLPVYCDVSLKAFDEVVPAAGSTHSAVRITPLRMAALVEAEWIDVCENGGQRPGSGEMLDGASAKA